MQLCEGDRPLASVSLLKHPAHNRRKPLHVQVLPKARAQLKLHSCTGLPTIADVSLVRSRPIVALPLDLVSVALKCVGNRITKLTVEPP